MAGSSPLSRGIPVQLRSVHPEQRIIPALAGNTYSHSPRGFGFRDHPRSRGEYAMAPANVDLAPGSSPLSRGIHTQSTSRPPGRGIIPALAGNTAFQLFEGRGERDHPRSRGEYAASVAVTGAPRGSSPLSRGIPPFPYEASCPKGIIPALAGNTPGYGSSIGSYRDHPRSRGEYASTLR